MRTIKFRAWDKDLGIYIPQFRDDYNVNEGFAGMETLMQFTGLLDKNGVEIYENDIVELLINDERPTHKGVVEYIAPKFFVMDGTKSGLILTDKYQVIGNRFENPELLKNTK